MRPDTAALPVRSLRLFLGAVRVALMLGASRSHWDSGPALRAAVAAEGRASVDEREVAHLTAHLRQCDHEPALRDRHFVSRRT